MVVYYLKLLVHWRMTVLAVSLALSSLTGCPCDVPVFNGLLATAVSLVYKQLQGMFDGYTAFAPTDQPMTYEQLAFVNYDTDIYGIIRAIMPSEAEKGWCHTRPLVCLFCLSVCSVCLLCLSALSVCSVCSVCLFCLLFSLLFSLLFCLLFCQSVCPCSHAQK